MRDDSVNHPPHYNSHPAGIECIDVVESFNFNIGNAIKYLWRQGLKEDAIEDLKKAAWYVQREIDRRENPMHVVRPKVGEVDLVIRTNSPGLDATGDQS